MARPLFQGVCDISSPPFLQLLTAASRRPLCTARFSATPGCSQAATSVSAATRATVSLATAVPRAHGTLKATTAGAKRFLCAKVRRRQIKYCGDTQSSELCWFAWRHGLGRTALSRPLFSCLLGGKCSLSTHLCDQVGRRWCRRCRLGWSCEKGAGVRACAPMSTQLFLVL